MSARPPGRFCLVLHTHMPYVEGYGTWPFGEEWLWEAMATSYLPLLDVLDAAPGRATLSLTPVLCDQLEAPGVGERFLAFLRDVRAETHRRDVAAAEDPALARELERSAGLYAAAAGRFEARGGDLVGAFAPHAAWTSAATHAVLPMLATTAGVRLQLETGIAAHRRRFGHWHGGLWLPECGYAPWLDEELEEAGVHAACVDLTDVLGYGAPAQLRPLRTGAGPLLVPIDRAIMDLVWHTSGYPSHGAYRNTRRYTEHRHTPVGGRRRALRPRARRAAGARRCRALRRPGRAPDRARRRLRVRARHRAARPLLARGGRLAGRGRRGVRRRRRPVRRARRGARRGTRQRPGAARSAADELGRSARPEHLERPGRGGARLARAGRRAAGPRRGRSPHRRVLASCASCWRCRPPTGRSG